MDYKTLINIPKTKRGRETLNRILSAAAQTFYEKGYHNSSIYDITRLAGISSGTFYAYFDSKYNLYKFLMLQCSRLIRKHLNQGIQHCTTRREMEEVGLLEWLKFVQQNQYVYHIIWESLYIDKQLFIDYYTTFSKGYIRGIDAAKKNGEIRSKIDSNVLAWTLMGAISFLGLNWSLFTKLPIDPNQIAESYIQILSKGIFAEASSDKKSLPAPPIRIEIEFDDDGHVI